jgi:hypothetical protein
MILIHCYSYLHTLQMIGLVKDLDPYGNQRVVVLTEKQFLPRIEFLLQDKHPNLGFVTYSNGIGATFFKSLGLMNQLKTEIVFSEINHLILPDLSYNLNPLLFGSVTKYNRDAKLYFYYDGINSLLSRTVSLRVVFSRLLKKIICWVRRLNYTWVKKSFNGYLDYQCIQYIPHNIFENLQKNNSSARPIWCSFNSTNLLNDSCKNQSGNTKKVIIFIRQDMFAQKAYDALVLKALNYLNQYYPKHAIYQLSRDRNEINIDGPSLKNLYFEMGGENFIQSSAEQIVDVTKPDIVVSHTSSALLNISCTDYDGKILSIFGGEFNSLAGLTIEEHNDFVALFEQCGVSIK